jgi:hypothetical protein
MDENVNSSRVIGQQPTLPVELMSITRFTSYFRESPLSHGVLVHYFFKFGVWRRIGHPQKVADGWPTLGSYSAIHFKSIELLRK